MTVRLSERPSERTCPLCRDGLATADVRACEGCATEYHGACLEELGGCASPGCQRSTQRAIDRAAAIREQVEDKLTDQVLESMGEPAYASPRRGVWAIGVVVAALVLATIIGNQSTNAYGAGVAIFVATFGLLLGWALSGIGDKSVE